MEIVNRSRPISPQSEFDDSHAEMAIKGALEAPFFVLDRLVTSPLGDYLDRPELWGLDSAPRRVFDEKNEGEIPWRPVSRSTALAVLDVALHA